MMQFMSKGNVYGPGRDANSQAEGCSADGVAPEKKLYCKFNELDAQE